MTHKEQELQTIFIKKLDDSEIRIIGEWFTGTANQKGYYECVGILSSLFDLYLYNDKSNESRPAIKIQGINQGVSQDIPFTEDLRDIFRSIDQDSRDVIYIRRRPVESGQLENHWVVFYFFIDENRKKNLLFIDTQNPGTAENSTFRKSIKSFQDFNLYISNTKVQKDDNSCGLIASEITRMLCSNHESVKKKLSKCLVQDGEKVELSTLLLNNEFQNLKSACLIKGNISYNGKDERFYAADIRIAHFATALAIGQGDINKKILDRAYPLETQDPEGLAKRIRSAFIGNKDSTKLFKKIVLKDSPYPSYISSKISSPQLERNQLLKIFQIPSYRSLNLRKEIKRRSEKIKELEETPGNIIDENKEKIKNKAQQLNESEKNVEQLAQNFDALQKEIESYKRTIVNFSTQLTTENQQLNDVAQIPEGNAQIQNLNNKNKKKSEAASAQNRKQMNYVSSVFMVIATLTIITSSLIMSDLVVSTIFIIAATLIFFAVGCYSLYKESTTFSSDKVNQINTARFPAAKCSLGL